MKFRPSLHVLALIVLAAAVVPAVASGRRPRQAGPDTPWEDLRSVLSAPDILNIPTVVEWREQCLDPMIFKDELPPEPFHIYGYDIGYAPAGVCMIQMSCMYPGCEYKFAGPESCPADAPGCITENAALSPPFDSSDLFDDEMELPAAVLHPKTVSDVVRGVEFAREHGVGISVKVVGHSYFGSSTARGTLLIKMSTNYPQYGIDGSLTECANGANVESNSNTADGAACDLATARGKKAYIRVGGGELFDTAYRAVFFDWNENEANENKYHFVGGYCGTVSAAGGWVQSGGLSGASMRLHGLGVDQVLHVEMVTPSGEHVRFGPTEWEEVEGYEQPKTTKVTGYCNANLHEDEALWEWTECEEDINFEDLWYAVRGGGGGTFGIVTSLYYQLHDLPGSVQVVFPFDADILTREDEKMTDAIMYDYTKFTFTFLFLPEKLNNVTEIESRSCNAPGFMTLPVGFYVDGVGFGNELYCHNSAGDKFIEEWKAYVKDGETGMNYGDNAEFMSQVEGLFSIRAEYPSQGYVTVREEEPYKGQLNDDFGVKLWGLSKGFHHVPLHTVINYLDELVNLMMDEMALGSFPQMYLMGGAVPGSTDQVDSLGPLRRDAAFSRSAPTQIDGGELYRKFYDLIWRDMNLTAESDFPGIYCHNHAANEDMGPLKEDWSMPCPGILEMSQKEREEKCVSQAESFWGTSNVARLEDIKKTVDPDELFICNAGIGASSPLIKYKADGDETADEVEGSQGEGAGEVDLASGGDDKETDPASGSPVSSSFYSKGAMIFFVLAMPLYFDKLLEV